MTAVWADASAAARHSQYPYYRLITRLGEFAVRASFELLIERASPSLDEFAAADGFDLLLLPARRRPLRAPGHPAAERLRLATGAELQIIAPRPQQRAHA
jgi:hypothetical protein